MQPSAGLSSRRSQIRSSSNCSNCPAAANNFCSTWQLSIFAYRDVQLLGIAVVMILGVSLRFLPHAYGLREPSRGVAQFSFWGVNGALVVGATSFIAGMTGHDHWLLALQWLCDGALLAIALGGTAPVHACSGRYRKVKRSRIEIHSRGLCLVHRSHSNAGVRTGLQFRNLHAANRIARSVFARILWRIPSRDYRRLHHDDDRRCVEQNCPNSVGR